MLQLSILLLDLTFPTPVWPLPVLSKHFFVPSFGTYCLSSYTQILNVYVHTVLIPRLSLSWNILPLPSAYTNDNRNSTPRRTSFIKLSFIGPSFINLSSSNVYWLLLPIEFDLAFH